MHRTFAVQPVFEGALAFLKKTGETIHFPLHRHEASMEILFIAEGEADYWIDGHHYAARAGDIVLFHPNVWHEERSRPESPFTFYYVGFHSLRLAGLPPDRLYAEQEEPVISARSNYDRIKRLFQDIVEEASDGWPEAASTAGLILQLLIAELHRTIMFPPPKPARAPIQSAVSKARRYIEERYHEPLTVKQVADHVYISPSHLSHMFAAMYGESPIQFAIRQRIEAACRYLVTTEYSVEKIAALVGYESVTAFQNVFKKSTGKTPGQFRKEASE
ncbi:AraC family transcriptional regulator [Paenibacillus thermotolerans]|uniref:AraC family transcriptional regulator n=1 Tax=Paenibacillus thermotolerans TaxID=3027807 RepID=UPI002367A754|nr:MULTISPECIES: AraC family transcriptional regulator [unclassified Paenibacillus]